MNVETESATLLHMRVERIAHNHSAHLAARLWIDDCEKCDRYWNFKGWRKELCTPAGPGVCPDCPACLGENIA